MEHIFANHLSEKDISELRELAFNTPKAIPWECYWWNKRFLVEELQKFIWYYDNRPNLRNQMACEYITIERKIK